jgi:uncharacterized protein
VKREGAFWDSSAFVPLCVLEASNQFVRQQLRRFSPVVWWGTSVEVHSAIFRLRRVGEITEREKQWAVTRLNELRPSWREILPANDLRELAERMLEKHDLRAGDSLQLAAALTWCGERAAKRVFLCGDERLSEAAEAEGFAVVKLPKS